MAKENKISVRLTDSEYWYLRRYASEQDKSAAEVLRETFRNHIIREEGADAAVNLLNNQPPK